jgi:hypothetical protein
VRSVAAALVTIVALAGCSDDEGRAAEGYCGQIAAHIETLDAPDIDDGADITRTLDVYRTITSAAPVAVEPEWQQLLSSLETAATVDPADPESLQRVADQARSTRPAATRIQQYTQQTCAIDIADPPPVTNPVTATTTPPTSTAPAVTGEAAVERAVRP